MDHKVTHWYEIEFLDKSEMWITISYTTEKLSIALEQKRKFQEGLPGVPFRIVMKTLLTKVVNI